MIYGKERLRRERSKLRLKERGIGGRGGERRGVRDTNGDKEPVGSHEGQQRRKGKVDGCGWRGRIGFFFF